SVALDGLAADAVRDAPPVEPGRPITMEVVPVTVEGDEMRLRQVVANLLANARVHTPPGAPVRVTLSVDGPVARVLRDGAELFMRLIDGEFPDYKQVIPKTSKATLTLSRQSFLKALGFVSVLSTERAKGVRVTLKPGTLEVQASNPDYGDGTDEVDAAGYSGDEVSIGFNGRYLIEALSAMPDAERVEFLASDDVSPGVLRPENDDSYQYVVMPMRL
ncbi:MAG: hypothetical protein ACRD2A_10955, partial [Vicinamibacterales bacterium]